MSRFTRKTVLALAAVATFGALALATNDASARPGGGGGGMRAHGGGGGIHVGGGGMRHIGGGGGLRRIGGGGFRRIDPGFGRHPHFRHRHVVHHHHRHWRWRWWAWKRPYWRPYYVAPVVATGVVASAPVWNRCNCLTKEYTPEGAVVFKDLCTKEVAMNPPAVQSGAYDPSQDPAALSSLQPQLQAQPLLPQTAGPQIR